MPLSKYNKFNAGKTKSYFPINKWRCDTSAHPVIILSDKCASSTPKALFSQQEMQMLVGLSNTLQCDEQNAVRIALYEARKSPVKASRLRSTLCPVEAFNHGLAQIASAICIKH